MSEPDGVWSDGEPLKAPPVSRLAWEALVTIGPRQALGRSPAGERFLVPILGGSVRGGFDGHVLQGQVLSGGADRQLLRPDGILELDALYEMQLDDGAVLTVHNRVLIDAPPGGARYAFSQVKVVAPEGPHAWLNRHVFVGTLHPLARERRAVLVRVWAMQGSG